MGRPNPWDEPLPDIFRLYRGWEESPPVYQMVQALAAWAGAWKPKSAETAGGRISTEAELDAFFAEIGGG